MINDIMPTSRTSDFANVSATTVELILINQCGGVTVYEPCTSDIIATWQILFPTIAVTT